MTAVPESCLRALRGALGPASVSTDESTLRDCSTDASPCLVPPQVVARPSTEVDVRQVVRICSDFAVPLTPRAAGTSLSGAAVGPGLVLDTARLSAIYDVREAERCVRVGPGVPLLELNQTLAERGFRFPLEPGSLQWCRVGGMIGHNASGYGSVKYGQTADYVLGLRVVLADGTVLDAREVPADGREWRALTERAPSLESVRRILEDHRDAILASRRRVRKHACGYGLHALVEAMDRGRFPLHRLFVGSEGTLGVVTEATLRILPRPVRTVTVLLFLESFEDMGPLVHDLLPLGPSAIEGVDGDSLEVLGRKAHGVPPGARAMVLVEFDEGDVDALAARVATEAVARHRLSCPPEVAADPVRQAALWKARRSLFPTLLRRPGPRRPWGFVEDPIVPTERVAQFIQFLAELTQKYGTVAGIYGHLGDGNTHYRPVFDPTDPGDLERMRALRKEFDNAVLDRFGGLPSGEHGIGRLRADLLPRIWGPEVYKAMQAIKEVLDPRGLLNPGVMFSTAEWWETWGGLESREPL